MIIRLFTLIIFFIFISYSFIFNINANNLKFEGLAKLDINDIQKLTKVDLDKVNFSENDINKLIKDLYKSDLIYNINLDRKNNTFHLTIEENKLIEDIYVNGNIRINDETIISNLTIKKNTFLNKENISINTNLIKTIYKSKGFNDINVSVVTEKFSDERVNLIFQINEGQQSKINRIKFIGNISYSDRYLSSLINSRDISFYNIFSSGSNLTLDNFIFDTNKIRSFYKEKGFFDARVNYSISSSQYGNYTLTFFIDEGNRIKVDDVIFEKNIEFENFITENVNIFLKKLSKNNNYFDQALVDEFSSDINNILIKNNIYNKTYQMTLKKFDESYKLVLLAEDISPEVINTINIYGNDVTKDLTIRSKLDFQPGDYFNQSTLNISKKNLLKYKYVNDLNISKTSSDGKADISIDINENKKTGQIMAAGTFSGDVGAGLTFGVSDSNIFGSGNNLNTNFNLNNENAQFEISLIQYPLASSKIQNSYSLFNTEKDLKNSFGFKSDEQGASYALNFDYNEKTSLSTGITYKRSKRHSPSKSTSPINDNIGNFDVYTLDFSIKNDTTNDFLYPSDGALNSLYFEYSPEDISDDSYYKVIVRSDYYNKFKNSNRFIFLSNDFGVAESLNKKLKTVNSFSLGGLNFKGYDYRGIGPKIDGFYVGGNKFFTSTIGVGGSFLFDEKDNISTKLFYSMGSIWDSEYSSQNDLELRSSIGISFDFLTVVGPISFSYAIPIDKQDDDRTREFNFSIGTSF